GGSERVQSDPLPADQAPPMPPSSVSSSVHGSAEKHLPRFGRLRSQQFGKQPPNAMPVRIAAYITRVTLRIVSLLRSTLELVTTTESDTGPRFGGNPPSSCRARRGLSGLSACR